MKQPLFIPKCYLVTLLLALLTTACDDEIKWGGLDPEKPNPELPTPPTVTELKGAYILCEGLFQRNNSTLGYYDFGAAEIYSFQDSELSGEDQTSYDLFKGVNRRKLGDTANDLQPYGSKLWCVVNYSSQIEVMELATGKSLKQIPLFQGENPRQPRNITFWEDKAYVCSFDGTVARIDTTTLAVDGYVNVGRNPDGICAANGKLYVANSGGLDYGNPDSTVSVVDIATFKEIKKIDVAKNLYTILSDDNDNVYVVSRGEFNYDTYDYTCNLHRIDSKSDTVITTFDRPIYNFIIDGHTAYMYAYANQEMTIEVMDTYTGEITNPNLLADNTVKIKIMYGLAVDPVNKDLYIMDAMDYSTSGYVHCFDKDGKHRFSLDTKGINPNAMVFLTQEREESEAE